MGCLSGLDSWYCDRNWVVGLDELSRLPRGHRQTGVRNEVLGRGAIGPNDSAGYDCCNLKSTRRSGSQVPHRWSPLVAPAMFAAPNIRWLRYTEG